MLNAFINFDFNFNYLSLFNTIIKFILDINCNFFLIGFLIIIPIGGADMPVVISMLNLFRLGSAGIGFTLKTQH